jgi:hypothetical protein
VLPPHFAEHSRAGHTLPAAAPAQYAGVFRMMIKVTILPSRTVT